jgi:hypothetical protein
MLPNQHIAHLPQHCHNSKSVIFQERPSKVLKCYNFLSANTTQLLSSGEFCKLRPDTIPVKSASANISFYTNNSKMPKFGVVTLLAQISETNKLMHGMK